MVHKLVIFDLDDTLINTALYVVQPSLCGETMRVLDYVRAGNHAIAVASLNHEAELIVERLGIRHYFDIVLGECPPCYTKMPLINEIIQQTDKSIDDVVFFDDLVEMTSDAVRRGICTKLVNWETGITMQDVQSMGL